jgi:heme-degrading monooxygenase HmoA
MTVLMTSEMPGTTQLTYEHLAAALLPILRSTDGFIAHAAGPVDGGFRVTGLWESEAAHDAWFKAHVAPTMPADSPPPNVTFRPIVNVVIA